MILSWAVLSYLAASLAGWRGTLSQPTRLMVALCGAVLGLAGVPLARLFSNPEGISGLWANVASTSLSVLVLCLPLFAILSSRYRLRYSVADGFLLGFLAGWGFDLAVLWARQAAGYSVPANWTLLAPWSGLAGLAAVAGRRFSLYEGWGWAWVAVSLAAAVAHKLEMLPGITPWATLAVAFLVGEAEARWLTGSPVYAKLKALPDLALLPWRKAFARGLPGVAERWVRGHLVRQVMLERTEMVKMNYTTFPAEVPEPAVSSPPDFPGLILAALAWGLTLFGAEGLWPLALAGIVFCFLRFPELEPEDPDGVARVRAEELLVNGSLFLALLVLVAGLSLKEVPNYGGLGPVALLIAFAASTLTGSRRGEAAVLRTASQRQLIRAHRLLLLVKSVLVALACAWLFGPFARLLESLFAGWAHVPIAVLLLGAGAALLMRLLNRVGDRIEQGIAVPRAPVQARSPEPGDA